MSPRRSSRARTTQTTPSIPQHTNSSTSSISSGRAERSTRSHHKLPPSRVSAPRSQSLDDADGSTKPPSRKTRSGLEEPKHNADKGTPDEYDEEDEEEVTRCICGNIEYPGLPASALEALKQATKDNGDGLPSAEVLPEDIGGLFIQCDMCKVWQHGGCVGILDEGMNPEEYFCEQCRKDLHKIITAPDGQKHSRYLPVQEEASAQASPEPSQREITSRKTKESKLSRPSAENLAHKRRSTMNSRDAAYDEAEQLRQAIEESKKEGGAPSIENGSRRTKRSRSDSEERKEDIKRQRTNSGSSSCPSSNKLAQHLDWEDEALSTNKSNDLNPKRIRGAAARNHREKEMRDREKEREKERADAAGRRKGRAERRRGDDSEPSEEPLSRTTSLKGADPAITTDPLLSFPETPPAAQEAAAPKTSHKKSGRPAARRGRVGRNQYSKDREARFDRPSQGHSRTGSLLDPLDAATDSGRVRRSRSRSLMQETGEFLHVNGHVQGQGYTSYSNGGGGGTGIGTGKDGTWNEVGKPSRPKHMNPNRTSMNEMKRRVAAILEFIARTQGEVPSRGMGMLTASASASASALTHNQPGGGGGKGEGKNGIGIIKDRSSDLSLFPTPTPTVSQTQTQTLMNFKHLSSGEMMRVLALRLEGWQREFGKWGDKSIS